MMNNAKKYITELVHAQNTGWIYTLRTIHGTVHEWYLFQKNSWKLRRIRKCNTVVATAFSGKMYGDNPRYIVEKIHALSPETEIVWVCADEAAQQLPSYIRSIPYEDLEATKNALASASVIIDNSWNFRYHTIQKDQLRIQTWHGGLGFKKIGVDSASSISPKRAQRHAGELTSRCDFCISNSDFLTKVYRSAFRYDGPVWKCGYPIEDALLTDHNEHRLLRERYHIRAGTRIVLYAPTFRSLYRWQCKLDVKQVTNAFQKRFGGDWVMLVHWHPHMCAEDRVLPGAIDAADTAGMQDLVKASDAFISDYSSSIFQAVQCDIPCFVYADDCKEYNLDRGLYYPLEEQPFPYAFTEPELLDNIANYDKAIWDEKWQQYRIRTGHVVTGHSAEDIAKICVDFLNGKPKKELLKEIPFDTQH